MTAILPPPPDWMDHGACVDHDQPDLWFPTGNGPKYQPQIDAAKAICAGCPVRDFCLQWAIATRLDHGIAGGLTEPERRGVARRQRRPGRKPQPIDHGTARGYRTHRRRGEGACDACMAAWREKKGVTTPRTPDTRPRPPDCAKPSAHGAVKHRRKGERPCEACSLARVAQNRGIRQRNARRAS